MHKYRLYASPSPRGQSKNLEFAVCEEHPLPYRAYAGQNLSLKNCLANFYWYIITLGRYRVWTVRDGEYVVHASYVIPKCLKFPFLKKCEYEIGPCFTAAEYRGRGIYPVVLREIINKGKCYMIIAGSNTASIRGATKAGFTLCPGYIRISRLKIYHYIED